MRMTFILPSLLILAGPLQAGPLEDLQAFLEKHPGRVPVRAQVSGAFGQTLGRRNQPLATRPPVPVELTLAEDAAGFQATWGSRALAEAADRSLSDLAPPGGEWLDPVSLSRTLNPVPSLQKLLATAKLVESREEPWKGRPAHRLSLRFPSPVPERYRKRALATEGSLVVWVAPEGTPLASDLTLTYQGRTGHYFGDFSRYTVQKATYQVVQDRLITATQEVEDRKEAEWEIIRTKLDLRLGIVHPLP